MWAPLEKAETAHDQLLLDFDGMETVDESVASFNGSTMALDHLEDASWPAQDLRQGVNGQGPDQLESISRMQESNGIQSMDMAHAATNGIQSDRQEQAFGQESGKDAQVNGDTNGGNDNTDPEERQDSGTTKEDNPITNGATHDEHDEPADRINGRGPSPSASMTDQPSHAMTTRAKARTPPLDDGQSSPLASPVPSSITSINQFFLPPDNSLPDQDYGLPPQEAEDSRRMLLLYVQKQEEVVRGTEHLLMGLLKADRRRKDVWRWCRAEGHVGEMSDGEDWYDKEEWSLTSDLLKGKEEEDVEDESTRKGRRRRDPKKTVAGEK